MAIEGALCHLTEKKNRYGLEDVLIHVHVILQSECELVCVYGW